MAGTSLLALIDDIAMVLDDVAIFTKAAAKKTAGVLGDDLALNAQQVAGVKADRELPVVLAVAKGSLLNKAILVPAALAISALTAWAVLPLLMMGGAFLCYEGFEKLTYKFLRNRDEDTARHAKLVEALSDHAMDLVAVEKEKIKGAVRTDFILSAEIIVISLGTVASEPFLTRLSVLTTLGLIMTVGVYGLVAGIVKLDDGGLSLSQRTGNASSVRVLRAFGECILAAAPWLMRGLAVGGTAAMFLVGGGILIHGIPGAFSYVEGLADAIAPLPVVGRALEWLTPLILHGVAGILAGALVVALVRGARCVVHRRRAAR
jgi:predicted DNA repair protein MutK